MILHAIYPNTQAWYKQQVDNLWNCALESLPHWASTWDTQTTWGQAMDLVPLHTTLMLITMASMNHHPPTHQLGILSTGWGGISHLVVGCALTFLVLTLSLVFFLPNFEITCPVTYYLPTENQLPPLSPTHLPTYLPTRSTPLFPT